VGNFEVGASDYFEGSIIPTMPGLQEGAVVISFDDPSGEHLEIRKDFTVNVLEMDIPEEVPPGLEQEEMKPPRSLFQTLLWGGSALLALAVIAFSSLIKV
jgi:hypothetical protein